MEKIFKEMGKKTPIANKDMWKIQNQRHDANFSIKMLKTLLLIIVAWMNMIALKIYFQASITNNEKWAIPKLFIA